MRIWEMQGLTGLPVSQSAAVLRPISLATPLDPLWWLGCAEMRRRQPIPQSHFLHPRIQNNVGVVIKRYTADKCRHLCLQKSSQSFSALRLLWQPSLIPFAFSSSSLMLDLSLFNRCSSLRHELNLLECSSESRDAKSVQICETVRCAITSCAGSQKLLRSC